MLETINLHKTMMEEEYKPEIRVLKEKLKVLQQKVKEAELPVIILVEGWSASGKGKAIARLIEELDPRNFKVHSTLESTKEEKRKIATRSIYWIYSRKEKTDRYWNESTTPDINW